MEIVNNIEQNTIAIIATVGNSEKYKIPGNPLFYSISDHISLSPDTQTTLLSVT